MKKIIVLSYFFLVLLAVVLWSEVVKSTAVEFAVLDIGQGDAVYIESIHGHQVLIDGGPDALVVSELSSVMPPYDKTLDVLILTHPDADHITGLIPVLEAFEVQTVIWTGKTRDTGVFKAWKDASEREGAEMVVVSAGDRIVLGDSGVVLDVLYPFSHVVLDEEEINETSLIMMMRYRENTVLLTGDTTRRVERLLVAQDVPLKADILKVAHHGSGSSSSGVFVKAVAPHTALISLGKDNRFGHPHDSVLANLAEYGILTRRTDTEGTIIYYFK